MSLVVLHLALDGLWWFSSSWYLWGFWNTALAMPVVQAQWRKVVNVYHFYLRNVCCHSPVRLWVSSWRHWHCSWQVFINIHFWSLFLCCFEAFFSYVALPNLFVWVIWLLVLFLLELCVDLVNFKLKFFARLAEDVFNCFTVGSESLILVNLVYLPQLVDFLSAAAVMTNLVVILLDKGDSFET